MFDLKAFREQVLPSQAAIISQWKGNLTSPVVSVICTAYNQESYIEDALKGFLMQKTDFPFEIIVHDDASTDKTAEIIDDYAKKYPLIIKTILQKNNQYSISGHLPFINAVNASSGEFLALCEGDDFWVDKNKIQLQYDTLNASPDIDLCFTSALMLENDKCIGTTASFEANEKVFPIETVIKKGGGFMPTVSLFLRAYILDSNFFESIDAAPVGDYYVQIYSSLKGGASYCIATTSVYRVNAINSWSVSTKNNDSISKIDNWVKGHEATLINILKYRADIEKDIMYSISMFYLFAAKRAFKLGLINQSNSYIQKVDRSFFNLNIKDYCFFIAIKYLPKNIFSALTKFL